VCVETGRPFGEASNIATTSSSASSPMNLKRPSTRLMDQVHVPRMKMSVVMLKPQGKSVSLLSNCKLHQQAMTDDSKTNRVGQIKVNQGKSREQKLELEQKEREYKDMSILPEWLQSRSDFQETAGDFYTCEPCAHAIRKKPSERTRSDIREIVDWMRRVWLLSRTMRTEHCTQMAHRSVSSSSCLFCFLLRI
jgi:hypothetical protein